MAAERRPRVLVGNVYFAPSSFGGATVVAENLAVALKEWHGWDVIVVAAIDDPALPDYSLRRYVAKGLDIIGVKVAEYGQHSDQRWINARFDRIFGDILDLVAPDIVHMHCVQNLGATCLGEVASRGIPLAVTVHDCFWICERQFMVMPGGRYCDQRRIDLSVCRYCVPDVGQTRWRMKAVAAELARADRLLFPSRFHRELHVENGFDPVKCVVNRNGVAPPSSEYDAMRVAAATSRLRFGFVGGPGPLKGANLINKAFNMLARNDYELVVVDAATHVGQSWRGDPAWIVPGKVTFAPAYTQATMDEFFAGIDVLLFPSQWRESFGLAVREASARGVHVIATDAGGVAEDLVNTRNATILPFGAGPAELAAAIGALLDSPRNVKGVPARVTTVADQARELDGLLREIAGERGDPAGGISGATAL